MIHCVLNQNARDPGAAVRPAVFSEVVALLLDREVGIVQMPCPETTCLGLLRNRPAGVRIRDLLDTPWGRRCCKSLACAVADQLQEHARSGHAVLAVVGGDTESPGCAVHVRHGEAGGGLSAESGVLMRALEEELRNRWLRVPFLSLRASRPDAFMEDLETLGRLLSGSGDRERGSGIGGRVVGP